MVVVWPLVIRTIFHVYLFCSVSRVLFSLVFCDFVAVESVRVSSQEFHIVSEDSFFELLGVYRLPVIMTCTTRGTVARLLQSFCQSTSVCGVSIGSSSSSSASSPPTPSCLPCTTQRTAHTARAAIVDTETGTLMPPDRMEQGRLLLCDDEILNAMAQKTTPHLRILQAPTDNAML